MISDGDALLFLDLISQHTRNMVSTSLKKKIAFTLSISFLGERTIFSLHNFHIAQHFLRNMTRF